MPRRPASGAVGVGSFVDFICGSACWWGEHVARFSCVVFAHQNLKALGRPRHVFPHAAYTVSLDHGVNAGGF